jgi:hypothetical protein
MTVEVFISGLFGCLFWIASSLRSSQRREFGVVVVGVVVSRRPRERGWNTKLIVISAKAEIHVPENIILITEVK